MHIQTATSGKEALELLAVQPVDLVLSDMRMPEMDGAQLLEQVFTRWPETKRILLTGYADASATIAAVNRGKIWRYISKPWNDDELIATIQQALAHRLLLQENARLSALTVKQNEELKELNAGLEQKVAERTAELRQANQDLHHSFLSTVQVFSSLIEQRAGRFAGKSRQVADLARQIAERMGLPDDEQRNVLLAGLLHDIGKIGLPDKLIGQAFNALSPTEKIEFMKHPVKGQQMLQGIPQLLEAARIIRHQHECMDGTGYPDQIGGLMIPLGARILAVTNDYFSLQSGALALHPHSPKEAHDFILKQRGKRYDPTVVEALTTHLQEAAARAENEFTVTPTELKVGMVLTRDLFHPDGRLLLPKDQACTSNIIEQMLALQAGEPTQLLIHVRRKNEATTLRDRRPEPPPRLYKEVEVPASRLKEGMTLSRHLHHHQGYLLLARGNRLDEIIIRQLRDIEKLTGETIKVHIQVDDR